MTPNDIRATRYDMTRHGENYDDDTERRAARDSALARTSICDLAPFNSICALRPTLSALVQPTAEHTMRSVPTRSLIANVVPRLSRRHGVIA